MDAIPSAQSADVERSAVTVHTYDVNGFAVAFHFWSAAEWANLGPEERPDDARPIGGWFPWGWYAVRSEN